MITYPQIVLRDADNPRHHVQLTAECHAQLTRDHAASEDRALFSGVDSLVKSDGGSNWLAYPDVESAQHVRYIWIMKRRQRAHILAAK